MIADDALVEAIKGVLMSEHHAPMVLHSPRDGSCTQCPWPLHALGPDEIATALLPLVREAQAEALEEAVQIVSGIERAWVDRERGTLVTKLDADWLRARAAIYRRGGE